MPADPLAATLARRFRLPHRDNSAEQDPFEIISLLLPSSKTDATLPHSTEFEDPAPPVFQRLFFNPNRIRAINFALRICLLQYNSQMVTVVRFAQTHRLYKSRPILELLPYNSFICHLFELINIITYFHFVQVSLAHGEEKTAIHPLIVGVSRLEPHV